MFFYPRYVPWSVRTVVLLLHETIADQQTNLNVCGGNTEVV